jgi:hypothetical protein
MAQILDFPIPSMRRAYARVPSIETITYVLSSLLGINEFCFAKRLYANRKKRDKGVFRHLSRPA